MLSSSSTIQKKPFQRRISVHMEESVRCYATFSIFNNTTQCTNQDIQLFVYAKMFGWSGFGNISDDPFFGHHNSLFQMDSMMSDFQRSMGIGQFQVLNCDLENLLAPTGQNVQRQHSTMSMVPFGGASLFGIREPMLGNIESLSSNPNDHSYSSSRVISYSSTGQGQPRYYEASAEMRQAPGGIKQTRKTERNSDSGLHRIEVGHHLYDRGHVVERSRNVRTGDEEEHQNFLNMDEEEKDSFHQEWQKKARAATDGRHAAMGHSDPAGGRGSTRRAIADGRQPYGRPRHRPDQDQNQNHDQNHTRDRERHETRS